jgi:hypothetical protein
VDLHRLRLPARAPFAAGVLEIPTNSFFLVSTEIAGSPWRRYARTRALMCSNWALRSGCRVPSIVLRLACRLYPNCWSSAATIRWLVRCPWRVNSAASRRTLLQVHRKGDSGSPRVVGSINFSKSVSNVGS